MRIDQLKYLIEISRNPSMNVASEKLHISYQALSHAMKALEEELNVILLRRTNKGTVLTEDGHKLVLLSKQFLSGLETIRKPQQVSTLDDLNGEVHFIATSVCMEYMLYDLIYDLPQKHPHLQLRYEIAHSKKLYEILQANPTVFAFTFMGESVLFNSGLSEEFCFHNIFTSSCKCICSPMHELAQYQEVSLQQLKKYRLAVRDQELLTIVNTDVVPEENIICESNPVLYHKLIASGFCFGLSQSLPFAPYQIPADDNVVTVRLHEVSKIAFGLLCHKSFAMKPQEEAFLRLFLEKYNFETGLLAKLPRQL